MTEKRFELRSYGNDEIWEMKDRQGESLITWGDIEKKLNQLAEENEKLKKELDNFKPVMFQDMRKGTVILYSKGDSDE